MTIAWGIAIVVWLAAYELGRRRLLADGQEAPPWRRGCWWAAALILVLVGFPPLADTAHDALWGETLQFALLTFGVVPLAVLAAPVRPLASLWGRACRRPISFTPAGGWAALAAFLAVTIGWRLPPAVDAVAGNDAWLGLEAVTLGVGTAWLWAAFVGSSPIRALVAPPRRIVMAAFAAWSVWIFAYVVGFSSRPFYPAYANGVTPVGTQQWVVAILWATSAAALVPVAFTSLIRWLSTEQRLAAAEEAGHRERRAHARAERVGNAGRAVGRSA